MKLLIFLLLCSSLFGNERDLRYELNHLDDSQKSILIRTYTKAKAYDLHYTMTAIAWIESNFGKHKVGRTSQDYGVFQININTFKRRYSDLLKKNPLSDKKIKHLLVTDYNINFLASVAELQFWKSVHKNNFNKIWKSYNAGYNLSAGKRYSEQIKLRIRLIKSYISEHYIKSSK